MTYGVKSMTKLKVKAYLYAYIIFYYLNLTEKQDKNILLLTLRVSSQRHYKVLDSIYSPAYFNLKQLRNLGEMLVSPGKR